MRKRAQRTVEELYGITEKIREPEITPVLEGNCRIQGPVDESDHELCRTNSGTFTSEKKFALINKSLHMRVESGTCNVCSAPCSSCMHNNRTMLAMESKMEWGSSRNSCATKEADSCSFICADGIPRYKSRICNDSQHAASEASNLLSASSSHDSYSENAESKATVQASVTCEVSEDVDMPPFVPLRETVKDKFLQGSTSTMGDCLFSSNSHITSDLCHRTSPKQGAEQGGLECHGDNMSYITGIKDSNIETGHQDLDLHMKNATCSAALADTSPSRKVENTAQVEATGCLHGNENKLKQSNCRRQITCPKESFQKKCAVSANVAFSDKSRLAEVLVSKYNSSPKVQSLCSHSQDGCVFCHNNDCKDSDDSSSCQLHVDGESSLGPQPVGASSLDEKKPPSNHENSKAGYTGNGFSADDVKISDPCLENENRLDKGISSDEVMKSSTMPISLPEASNMQEPQIKPHQDMEGGNSESEAELTDVKVCDICGDAGREELLAFCSRCSDGAEHTYCMREKLRKVPEGDWLCEECQLKENAEMKKVDRPEKLSEAAIECKLKEDGEVKKVDRSAKVSATAKEFKLKEFAEAKKVGRSEVLTGTSRECKQKEDGESKTVETFETVAVTSKLTCLNETKKNFASPSNSKLMPKLDIKAVDPDVRRVPKGLQSPKISAKRHAESQEVISSNSKRPHEISGECIEMGSPRKKPALSREGSFKNLDTGKARVPNMTPSNSGQTANSSKGFSRSQSMLGSHSSKVLGQLQPHHGLLSRSSSFNNLNLKPKVKQLTESVPVKQKISRVSSLNDTGKVALGRSTTKSSSFKNISSRSNTESTSKTQSIHQSLVEDPKSLKLVKERNMIEKHKSSMVDRQSTNLSPRAANGIPLPRMGTKTAPCDVKLNNMSESNILKTNKGSDDANGRNEANKQSTYSSKMPGSASLNAKVNNEDQRPCQIPKESARKSSNSADKLYNNAETVRHRGVLQTAESTHRDDETKDPGIFSGSRQAISVGNQILRCQRCNETGHATEFCSNDKLRSSPLKASSEKNSKDGHKKGNKWKDAVETAISKSRLQKNNRQSDKSDEFPISTADPSCKVASKDFLSSSSSHSRNITLVGTSDALEILRSSDVDTIKTTHVTDVGLQFSPPVEASSTPKASQTIEASCTAEGSNLNATVAVSDEMNMKHLLRMLPDQASVLANPYRTSAIPELEFIWQGSLEVLKSGNGPTPFDGIQAHLSTSASPKVLEVATKLPCRVQLEEVSYISSWPLHSQGICPNERNIALFFFAKDVESYERSYSKLLEKMLKNDLALRGIIDGVDLLLFPSTKLPVHSQRWNRLFFLWGIFKGRRTDSLTSQLSAQKKPSGPILNMDLTTQDLPCDLSSIVSDSQRAVSVANAEKSPSRDISPKAKALKPSTFVETWAISSPKVEDRICRVQDSSLVHNSSFQTSAYDRLPLEQSSYTFPLSHSLSSMNQLSNLFSTHTESRFQMTNTPPCSKVKNDETYPKNFGYDFEERHVATPSAHGPATTEQIRFLRVSPSCSTSDWRKDRESSTSERRLGEDEISMKNEAVVYDPRGKLTGIDDLSWEESPNRKRARLCSAEALSRSSGETTKNTSGTMLSKHEANYLPVCLTKNASETMLSKDEANYLPVCLPTDDEREQKRMSFCEGHASNSFREETLSARSSSKVHPLLASFLTEQPRESADGDSNEAVIYDNSRGQVEKFFFPMEPSPMLQTKSDKLIHILSSDDEDDQESNTPNLELALGGKWKKQKERQRKGSVEDDEDDDVSASLSLSLAIPTPKKEWSKSILKPEQHLQDRPDVNTALHLFGGFTGT